MIIYFVTFTISYLICQYGEHVSKYRKKKISICLMCLAALIVAVLAGVRDYTIGTDIATYGHWLFKGAQSAKNPISFALANPSIDFLYSIMVYFIAFLFDSEHWLYFFTGVLIYGFTIAGFIRYRKSISISMAWLSFLFLFYGDTLNAMRQCIAMAIIFFAFSYFQEGNTKKYFIFSIIACLFHKTAVIVFAFSMIYKLLEKKNTLKMRCTILLITITSIIGYSKLVNIAVNLGVLDGKFLRYGTQYDAGFSLNPIIIRAPYLIILVAFYYVYVGKKEGVRDKVFADFILLMMIVEMLTAEMRVINPALYRISLYFGMYRVVGIGRLIKALKSNNKIIVYWLILIILIVTWIYQNVIQGNNQIYPFTSELIGI